MAEKKVIIPRFLTEGNANLAVETAIQATLGNTLLGDSFEKNPEGYIAVYVDSVEDVNGDGIPDWKNPASMIRPALLHRRVIGDQKKWNWPYDAIGESKASQRLQGRCTEDGMSIPHVLFPGETPYWGTAMRDGILVLCSGFEEYQDRMISEIVLSLIIGLAAEDYRRWNKDERPKGVAGAFLPAGSSLLVSD